MLRYKYFLKKRFFNTVDNLFFLDQSCNKLQGFQICQSAFLHNDLNQFLQFNQAIQKCISLTKLDHLFIKFYELNSLKVWNLHTYISKSLFSKPNVCFH